MEFKVELTITLISAAILVSIIFFFIYLICVTQKSNLRDHSLPIADSEHNHSSVNNGNGDLNHRDHPGGKREEEEEEDLICFQGGENLSIPDILDAPGEVIGKSSYGTLYKANLVSQSKRFGNGGRSGNSSGGPVTLLLLRFLRPACSIDASEVLPAIRTLGVVRHQNLVPLKAFYLGSRGEKLMVHPYYSYGNLAQFIKDGNAESRKWEIIYKISCGIARGLNHLHTGLRRPIVHGNLKSKNILLNKNFQPYISDYGIHLLLNAAALQELLDASIAQGYRAPDLSKMKDVGEATDIYSFGVVLMELITGKEPVDCNASDSPDFYLSNAVRSAILDHRIADLYHPDIHGNENSDQRLVTENRVLKLVQIAVACCSPSPDLRPKMTEVLRNLESIDN